MTSPVNVESFSMIKGFGEPKMYVTLCISVSALTCAVLNLTGNVCTKLVLFASSY